MDWFLYDRNLHCKSVNFFLQKSSIIVVSLDSKYASAIVTMVNYVYAQGKLSLPEQTNTCLKPTTEALEKGVKYMQS